jgi:uncharacterized lipoprotein YmbA
MKQIVSMLLAVIVLCAGCSSQPVQTSEYLLRPQTSNFEASSASTIVLGRIEVAPYLAYEGIVLEVAPGQLNTAQHNLWAEPLEFSVRRYLQVAISNAAKEDVGSTLVDNESAKLQIDVIIHQMHATSKGDVKLVAEWRLQDLDSDVLRVRREFSATEALRDDGYPEVVRAHAKLLDALASSIANGIDGGDP